jgi:NAD(P)-dependent dehydrogenase (short-subunit alcohol dehydrogenase family)
MMGTKTFVTGGAGEIGAAICEKLTADGRDVVVIDLNVPAHGFCSDHIRVNIADPQAVRDVVAPYCAAHRVTRLVNNAGIIKPADVDSTTVEDFSLVMDVNVRAAMQLTQLCLPAMREAGFGRVVNISSRAALGKALRTAYAASKAAMIGMTKTMALELGRDGITLNAIGPGPIRTRLFADANPPDSPKTKAIMEAIPVGFMGEPKDVAAAVAFLLTDEARFITGQTLYVCGGMTVGLAGA